MVEPYIRYFVYNDSIRYNGIIYNIGDTFEGILGIDSFIGNGLIKELIIIKSSCIELFNDIIYNDVIDLSFSSLEIIDNVSIIDTINLTNDILEINPINIGKALITYAKD